MKNTLRKYFRLAMGLAVAVTLPSCLQNETTISLNKDGSGTIVEETTLGAQMMQMMTQFAQPGQPDPIEEMFAEKKAKEKATSMGEGVEYVKTEIFEKDGKKGAKVHYKFADINKISVNPSDAVNDMQPDGAPAEEGDDEAVKFAYADGKLKIIVPPADFDDMSMDDQLQDPQQEAMMMQMMADMRLTLKLKIPSGIEKTTATHVEGDTITLFDVQVGKMFAQKDKLKEISETAKTDMDAAKAAFNKVDGIKVETKENATVTLK
ncbi:MAG: hypothetical protein AB8D78_01030 [Akkermansiaceae bacterium]